MKKVSPGFALAFCLITMITHEPALGADDRPTLWTEGDMIVGESVTVHLDNPFFGYFGAMVIASQDHVYISKVPSQAHIEFTRIVPNDPGLTFTCQFFSFDGTRIVPSNLMSLRISSQGGPGSFYVEMDAFPTTYSDQISGWAQNPVVLLPLYMTYADNVQVADDGLVALEATVIGPDGPRIVAQQFNAFQVYNRNDPSKRRAKVVHGYVVLDSLDGQNNQSVKIRVESSGEFSGSDGPMATPRPGGYKIDTGVAKFRMKASQDDGFRFDDIEVYGKKMLTPGGLGGVLTMQRRRPDGGGVDFLTSEIGSASAQVTKNGSAYVEILVQGDLRSVSDPSALPQRYLLSLEFHQGSAEVQGELMLTNWRAQIDGQSANYNIAYDGFGVTFQLANGQVAPELEVLMDGNDIASYSLFEGRQVGMCFGYRAPKHSMEFLGLDHDKYWTENERIGGRWAGDNFKTKGYVVMVDGERDSRYHDRFADPGTYPLACAAHLEIDDMHVAVMSGLDPAFSQPNGIQFDVTSDSIFMDVRLTDPRAENLPGKSIPFRAAIRKNFVVDFNYFRNQGLPNFARHRQAPYVGVYSEVEDYSQRFFRYTMINDEDRNEIWRRLGFLKPWEDHLYADKIHREQDYTFYIGSNRTGGIANWDQALIDLLSGLHGNPGYLRSLRGELNFHTVLGKRGYEDDAFELNPSNPEQQVSEIWEIDIEHEDHIGFHAGVSFYGKAIDAVCLSRQAYITKDYQGVGGILWLRAVGNRLGRMFEEQGILRTLFHPQYLEGHAQPIEDLVLESVLSYFEDLNRRRVDPSDPCNSGGWTAEPALLPAFGADPMYVDFPTASLGAPYRYPWVSKDGWFKTINMFHLRKGLSSILHFAPNVEEFPSAYQARVAELLDNVKLRLAQGGMTFAQMNAFIHPYCGTNFEPDCEEHRTLPPWYRFTHQRKWNWTCMGTCDSRVPDEDNNWMGYEYADAYVEAAAQYLERGDRESCFYMLRSALNHLSTQRWKEAPSSPCEEPPDTRDNNFFENSIYSGTMRLWAFIRDEGFLPDLGSDYPNLFPMEVPYGGR